MKQEIQETKDKYFDSDYVDKSENKKSKDERFLEWADKPEKKKSKNEKSEKKQVKRVDILTLVDKLFDTIEINKKQEQEVENEYLIIDNLQRRQFQYSKYRTEVLSNSCNKDNLTLTKVLSSMPLYKQEKIYELKKQGLKDFVEQRHNKSQNKLKALPQIKKRESIMNETQRVIPDTRLPESQQINESEGFPIRGGFRSRSPDESMPIRGGLRMRSPDETLTFLKNNFGVIVRPPQKFNPKSRKELEDEEKKIETERRKIYNVDDKLKSSLELYYKRVTDNPSLLTASQKVDKSRELSPMGEKEARKSIFNRNLYYVDHYNNIKLSHNKENKFRNTQQTKNYISDDE